MNHFLEAGTLASAREAALSDLRETGSGTAVITRQPRNWSRRVSHDAADQEPWEVTVGMVRLRPDGRAVWYDKASRRTYVLHRDGSIGKPDCIF